MSANRAEVALFRWPEDRQAVESRRRNRGARLLLVAAHSPPPVGTALEEDWIRLPASAQDIDARVSALVSRLSGDAPEPIELDDCRLAVGNRWVTLSNHDEALCRVLVDNLGKVSTLAALSGAPAGKSLSANALRVHLTRLRPRLEPLGLVIRSVQGRGYILDLADSSGSVA